MNELFPIIRRKRRPLVEDIPPMMVDNVEPPKVEATEVNKPAATQDTTLNDNAEASNQSESR